MDIPLLLRAIILGITIAAPVGPMAVLCIRRTLSAGQLAGLATGMGIATADGVYAAVAGFGLTAVSELLLGYGHWLRTGGGLVLCWLGLRAARSAPGAPKAVSGSAGLLRGYGSAIALTLANPSTILSFAGVLAGLGAIDSGSTAVLVAGIFTGSALWWVALTGFVSRLRDRLSPAVLLWVNRISGGVLLGFGLAILLSVAVPI